MKKVTIFSLVLTAFILVGCTTSKNIKNDINQETEDSNQNQKIIEQQNIKPANNNSTTTYECVTKDNKDGFIMHDGNCYAPGENIPDTDCTVSITGGCMELN
jgi:hypothetical protein